MKSSTLYAVLIAGLFITCQYSCKKPSAVPHAKTTTTTSTNPIVATSQCDYDFNDTLFTNHGWAKAFDDEFTGDLSHWYAYTGGVKNELEYNDPANAQIVSGVLQLSVKQQTETTYNYTSASIVSNATYSASAATPKVRIVARIKVASGYGLTSILNMYGPNWPTNGQINLLQVAGSYPTEYATDYFYGTQAGVNLVNNAFYFNPVDNDLSACYHVYMTDWTQNSLNYYLDGKLVETKTTGGYIPGLYGKAENLAISLPIGGLYYQNLNAANIQTGTMYVDYVKVFTSN